MSPMFQLVQTRYKDNSRYERIRKGYEEELTKNNDFGLRPNIGKEKSREENRSVKDRRLFI